MLILRKPELSDKDQYIEMIGEWQMFGGPYVPCIVDFDCSNKIEELNYNSLLEVVKHYGEGNLLGDDKDYFESSDFYFVFDKEKLIGVCEVRKNLTNLGEKTIGHLACGIRPAMRAKGYATIVFNQMLSLLKKDGITEAIGCCYAANHITPKIFESLGFTFKHTITSDVSKKEINCYLKTI